MTKFQRGMLLLSKRLLPKHFKAANTNGIKNRFLIKPGLQIWTNGKLLYQTKAFPANIFIDEQRVYDKLDIDYWVLKLY